MIALTEGYEFRSNLRRGVEHICQDGDPIALCGRRLHPRRLPAVRLTVDIPCLRCTARYHERVRQEKEERG